MLFGSQRCSPLVPESEWRQASVPEDEVRIGSFQTTITHFGPLASLAVRFRALGDDQGPPSKGISLVLTRLEMGIL